MVSVSKSCSYSTTSDGDAKNCCHQHQYRDWSSICADLLEHIQKKLTLDEILSCRAVCSSWRSVTKTHLSSSPPPLILWRKESESVPADEGHWGFFDVLRTDGGNLCLQNKKSEKLLAGMGKCVGYSNGYFMFLDKYDKETICLFHPTLFSGSLVRFPAIKCSNKVINDGSITRALLWGNPFSSNGRYGITLMHGGCRQLLFAKCGATRFTQLESQTKMAKRERFVDIVCVNNWIYGITQRIFGSDHYIKAWDCRSSTIGIHGVPKKMWDFKPKFSSTFEHKGYLRLVESQGEPLLVAIARPERRSIFQPRLGLSDGLPACVVYKMDFKKKAWVRMSSLGDRVLFIREFQAMSLSTHEFPQYQKNSVYFWHSFVAGHSFEDYLGIFNMDDGSLKVIDVQR